MLYITALMKEEKEIIGLRLLDISKGGKYVRDIPFEFFLKLHKENESFRKMLVNISWDGKKLVGTQGSVGVLPTLNQLGVLINKPRLTVLYRIDNKGYGLADMYGAVVNVENKRALTLANRFKLTNGEVYSDGKEYKIRPQKGSFPVVSLTNIKDLRKERKKAQQDKKGYVLESPSIEGELPSVTLHGSNTAVSEEMNMPAQQKLMLVNANLKKIAPYYWSMYTAIRKVPVPSHVCETMGVTENMMIYNNAFVAEQNIGELTFIVLHEMYHIAMYHPLRIRANGIDTKMMNIAQDLYVNECICKEFDVWKDCGEVEINGGVICTPNQGVFLSTIDETLDFEKDTAESIYYRLMAENQPSGAGSGSGQGQQQQNSQGQGQGQGQGQSDSNSQQQGNGGQSQGQGQQSQGNNQETNNGSGQGGSEDGQSQSQQGQNGAGGINNGNEQSQNNSGQGNSNSSSRENDGEQGQGGNGSSQQEQDGSDNGNGSPQQFKRDDGTSDDGNGQGNNSQGDSSQNTGNNSSNGQGNQGQSQDGQTNGDGENMGDPTQSQSSGLDSQGNGVDQSESVLDNLTRPMQDEDYVNKNVDIDLIYKGKHLRGLLNQDIMSNHSDDSPTAIEDARRDTKDTLNKILVKRKMDEQKSGMKTIGGPQQEIIERSIDFALAKPISWEKILDRFANKKPKKKYTMNKVNRSHAANGIYLPDRDKIGDNKKIENIFICVDVSGSIGETELHRVYTRCASIIQKYEVSAKIIFWDTAIENVGEFTDLKSLLAVKPLGGGGTDIRCVFDYISGRVPFRDKKNHDKPSVIIIFTDGCIGSNYGEYSRYNQRTVWVIDDGNYRFEPLFGRIARESLRSKKEK